MLHDAAITAATTAAITAAAAAALINNENAAVLSGLEETASSLEVGLADALNLVTQQPTLLLAKVRGSVHGRGGGGGVITA